MNDHVRQLGAESEMKYAAYDILHKTFRFNNLLRSDISTKEFKD